MSLLRSCTTGSQPWVSPTSTRLRTARLLFSPSTPARMGGIRIYAPSASAPGFLPLSLLDLAYLPGGTRATRKPRLISRYLGPYLTRNDARQRPGNNEPTAAPEDPDGGLLTF